MFDLNSLSPQKLNTLVWSGDSHVTQTGSAFFKLVLSSGYSKVNHKKIVFDTKEESFRSFRFHKTSISTSILSKCLDEIL